MKKQISIILSIVLIISALNFGFFGANAVNQPITISDNEKGWVNSEIRYTSSAQDVVYNSIYASATETSAYDIDGDNFSVAWNYAINGFVNPATYDFIEKNLESPVCGGTFEFYFWLRNAGGVYAGGSRVEAIAYEPDGTAHNLGKSTVISPKSGTPTGISDSNWYIYSKSLPDVNIIKIEIRMTNADTAYGSWGIANLDNIKIKNTVVSDYTRIGESGWTPVYRLEEMPTVVNGTVGYYYEGSDVAVLSGGINPYADHLKSFGMEKTLTQAVSDGYLEYKVYYDTTNSSLPNAYNTKTKAIAYDAQGNSYDLGISDSIIKYGAWLGGGFIEGGWNQYRAALPEGIDITKVQIFIVYNNSGCGPVPYYIDDIKVVYNTIKTDANEYYSSDVGMWYTVWWDSVGQPYYQHHWVNETRSTPVKDGYYATDDVNKITSDLTYFKNIGIDYLILDDTNGHGADNGNIASHINTIFNTTETLGANAPRLSIAGGGPLLSGNTVNMANEMNIFYNFFETFTQNFFTINNKPLFVNFTTANNFGYTDDRFTMRNAIGHTSEALNYADQYNLYTNGLYGWVFDTQYEGSDVYGINPGWSRTHNGLNDGGKTPISRENGDKYRNAWLDAIKANPKTIVVSSWNDHAEETGIEAVSLSGSVAGRELESNDPYMYQKMTEGYLALKTGYLDGYLYRAESDSRIYRYTNGSLIETDDATDAQLLSLIIVPDDYYNWAGVARVQNSIEDNEKGWVNEDIRFNDEAKDVLNNSVYTTSGETSAYDTDGDSFSLAWNYSMYAFVNSSSFDSLVKNLAEPVTGGTFNFDFWVRNAGGVDPNGLKVEAIAYEADGTSYSLGISPAVTPKTGTPTGANDTNLYSYSGVMPYGRSIVKMELRLYNGNGAATTWGVVNIDNIRFKNAAVSAYTRISETGWTPVIRTSETPTVTNGSIGYYNDGGSNIIFSTSLTPDANFLKTASLEKTLDTPISGGYFEYKVYMDAYISSKPAQSHVKYSATAYDANGTAYDLGVSENIVRYGAWNGGGMIFGGWNQYRAALPVGIEITKIRITLTHFENGGMGFLPYYIDDIKMVNVITPDYPTGDVTKNGIVDTLDLVQFRNALLGKNTIDSSSFTLYDIDKNNKFNIVDLLELKSIILK